MTTRMSVDDVFRLAPTAGDRHGAPAVELLDGVLIRGGLPSAAVVTAVVRLASELDRIAHSLDVDVRGAIACPPADVLRPEVVLRRVVPPHRRRPAPGPDAVVVAVLVSEDASHTAWRARRCGVVGIEEVWTIVIGEGHAVRLGAPRGGVYSEREMILPGERVAPASAPWLAVVPIAARASGAAAAPVRRARRA